MRISDWSSDVCSSDLLPEGSPPAGHIQQGAGHVRGFLAEQPDNRFRHFRGCARTAQRHRGAEAGGAVRLAGAGMDVGFDDARSHGVDADALGAEFLRQRSDEHTSELQSLMRISYAVFCLKKKN